MQTEWSDVTLELRDFRWAVTASLHRSLRKAAEALNIRQSTLSRRLRDLENELGARLFERTNGGTHPTVEGLEFLEAAKRIVEEAEVIGVRLRERSRGEAGRLGIGVHTSLSAGNLRATLIEHHRRFPAVRRFLVDGTSDHLLRDLASSNVDIAFLIVGDQRWDDRQLPVWSERVVAALSEDHPLAPNETICWEALKGESILLPLRGPGAELRNLLEEKIGPSALSNLQHHDVSLDRLLTLAGAGSGILLALEGATGVIYRGVVFREVHGSKGPERLNFRALWRQENHNPSLRLFLDVLQERYPDLCADTSAV